MKIKTNTQEKLIEIKMAKDRSLWETLTDNELVEAAPCGGNGTCGKCKVRFRSPVPEPTERDLAFFSSEDLVHGYRLACQIWELEDNAYLEINSPKANLTIEDSYFKPISSTRETSIERVSLEELTETCSSLHEFLEKKLEKPIPNSLMPHVNNIYTQNPSFSPETNPLFATLVDGAPVAFGTKPLSPVGLVMDIGTTTIVLQALSLEKGEVLASQAFPNPQRIYGADVITRIGYCDQNGPQKLCKSLQQAIGESITGILKTGITSHQIVEMVICGNTTMLHLLRGLNPGSMGRSPFIGLTRESSTLSFREIFLSNQLECPVTLMPGLSAFVGADIMAGVQYLSMAQSEEPSILIDLGTNGEMVIGNRHRLIGAATACGPAFEGGELTHGCPALEGAICEVSLKSEKMTFKTIANKPPLGICGTGAISLLAQLVRHSRVDETGLLDQGETEMIKLAPNVFFSAQDIRQLQLAKSAIRAGLESLITEYGCPLEEIKTIYLAGGFGQHINIQDMITLGMLPQQMRSKVFATGNTALAGATQWLLQKENRLKLSEIKARFETINLSFVPNFQNLFSEHLLFPTYQ